MMIKYDSATDTKIHKGHVGDYLEDMIDSLKSRAVSHDNSKLESPEKEVFDRVTPKLKQLTYGSEEYKASLEEMGTALTHHYENNRHHPEHFMLGIDGMTLVDLVEMMCDWKSATLRHDDGDIRKSLEYNAVRFGITPQLYHILLNTIEEYLEEE